MITINSNINLGRAFENLKDSLKKAEDKKNEYGPDGYAYGYGFLTAAIKSHILMCTGENLYERSNVPAANVDDLKDLKI